MTRPTGLRHAAIGGVLLLGLTTTACAGTDTSGGTSSNASPAQLTENDIASFTFAIASPPPSYDRATSAQPAFTGVVMSLVTEPLERVNPDGTFIPVLASKVTQPDPTTIVYQVRKGVRFSNGHDLTAEDVSWSLTHTGTPPAQTSASTTGFKSATVTGPLEVTVKLAEAVPDAREDLARATVIQEKAFATAHASNLGTPNAIPVGSGPYEIASATASGITLNRRDAYWGPKPKVKQLNIKAITDDNSAQLAMRSGEAHLRQLTNVKTAPQWRAIPGTTVYSSPSGSINFVAMDVTKPPFDDLHVRKAIAHATDVPGLIQASWGGEATPLSALIPAENMSAVSGGDQAAQQFLTALPKLGFDLDKAKAELAQSGHPQGFRTTVEYIDAFPATKVLALSLQQNLKPLGIEIETKSVTLNAWSARFYQHQLTGLILGFGFTADGADPVSPLGSMVGKQNIGPQKPNLANFTTDEVEKALPVLRTAGDSDKRWAATQTLLTQIAEQVPYVPLATENFLMAIGKGYASSTGTITARDMLDGSWALNLRATTQQ